jgi:YVTN family beta-propeller protein
MLQFFILAVRLLLPGSDLTPPPPPTRSCGIAVTPDGAQVIAVNPDSGSVSLIDAARREVIAEIATGGEPQTLALASNGRLFVAARSGVHVVDLAQRRVVGTLSVGADAFGVVADGLRLYVSATGSSQVRVFDLRTLTEVARIATSATPRGLAIDPARGRLYVTHFRTGKVTIIRTDTLVVEKILELGADNNLAQGIVVDRVRGRLYMPRTRMNSFNNALLFDTTVFPIVAVVNSETEETVIPERLFLDIADRPVNMPIDVVVAPSGHLYVVNAGSDDVSVIDLTTRRAVAHLAVGSNPRSIALSPDGLTAYVNNTLSGTVTVIDTAANAVITNVKTTTIPMPEDILIGKIAFHTSSRPTLAKDQWISCATCHFDGGADGLTWFFRDGPRNTPALFGVGSTSPFHWSGDLDELQDVEETIRIVQAGNGLVTGDSGCTPACNRGAPNAGRARELDALAAFMRFLKAPPVEIEVDKAAASRGEAIFADARTGCASCHIPPLFIDRKTHNVGTGLAPLERKGFSFDTPSLRGLHDMAPYFHDGSAATLHDVVNGATGQHGNTTTLTQQERDDLVAFLRSIPFPTAGRRRSVAR